MRLGRAIISHSDVINDAKRSLMDHTNPNWNGQRKCQLEMNGENHEASCHQADQEELHELHETCHSVASYSMKKDSQAML